ncbi:MAG: tetratricopeptide repeat protein [Candidatus Obscuribacter sp.]|nr:tetratricopeptide repeat protein [Candidatus Obscuribacter sp.]
MNGIGGPKDCQGGISLLKALAEQSVLEAQNRLGHYYRIGNCVEKDLVSAKYWLEKAASRNYLRAINELACLYFYGEGVPRDLKKAFDLNLKVARLKDADPSERASSEYGVGLAYDKGWGVKRDLKQARIWYARAAAAGNPHACNNLSNIYMEGRGCPANPALAMSLRRLGVKNGCWMACQNLAADYQHGLNGVSKNISEAIRLYKKSLELRTENPIANFELAKIYEHGLAGKENRKLALQYYVEAAKYGSAEARKKLGQQPNQTTKKYQN